MDPSRIQKKIQRAREGWRPRERQGKGDERVPPGQRVVQGFPVLDLGIRPEIPLDQWRLEVGGLVAHPVVLTWEDYLRLPQEERISDFHCVTGWSTLDNRWEGVPFHRLVEVVQPHPEARYVFFTSYDGYSTNLPLEVLMDPDVLLAHRWNGAPLTREHGGPVRLVVPSKYAWKSAKWVRGITFMKEDRRGFWEVRGYSNTADPWTEDRYA